MRKNRSPLWYALKHEDVESALFLKRGQVQSMPDNIDIIYSKKIFQSFDSQDISAMRGYALIEQAESLTSREAWAPIIEECFYKKILFLLKWLIQG